MTTRTAGPDYWFVDPAYYGIDRLTEDECPMDIVQECADEEWLRNEAAYDHSMKCHQTVRLGLHSVENCSAPGRVRT